LVERLSLPLSWSFQLEFPRVSTHFSKSPAFTAAEMVIHITGLGCGGVFAAPTFGLEAEAMGGRQSASAGTALRG
jgi:hypothetical protein